MRIAIVALTKNGLILGYNLGKELLADVYTKESFSELIDMASSKVSVNFINGSFKELIKELFIKYENIIMIMATGIVVRTIADLLKSKTQDPAIVVVDEKGKFAISLLSGHIGGGNELASLVAKKTGGQAVITTATDVNKVLAFDMVAKENDLFIQNINELKYISSDLVNGGKVILISDLSVKGALPNNIIVDNLENKKDLRSAVVVSNELTKGIELPEKVLYLKPKNLVLGIGCRRDTSKELIEESILDFLKTSNKSINSINTIASVDLKADEKGLIEFSKQYNIDFKTIDREEIKKIEKDYSASEFVKEKIGVSNVCETSAVLASTKGKLIIKKTVYSQITLALVEEEKELCI